MSSIRKQSVYGGVLAIIGVLVGFFNSGYFQPLVLEVEELGILRYILSISTVAIVVSGFGISNIIPRFFPFHNKQGNSGRFWGTVTWLLLVGLFLGNLGLGIYLNFFQDGLNSSYWSYVHGIFSGFFVFACMQTIASVLANVSLVIFMRDIFLKLGFIILLIVTLIEELNFYDFLLGVGSLYILSALYLFFHYLLIRKGRKKFSLRILPINSLKPMLSLGVFAMLASAATFLMKEVDLIMVTQLCDFEASGIYGLMIFISVLVGVPSRGLIAISTVKIGEAWSNGDLAFIKNLYTKTAQNQVVIAGSLYLLLVVNLVILWEFIPNGEVFSVGKWVALWLGLGQFVDLSSGISGEVLNNSSHYKLGVVFSAGLFLSMIGLNFLLIPEFGISGAAFGTFLSQLVHNLLRWLVLYWKFGLNPFNSHFLKSLLLFLGLFLGAIYYTSLGRDQGLIEIGIINLGLIAIYGFYILLSSNANDLQSRLIVYFGKIGINLRSIFNI
jgi:O-antigen/teichoic acid export membrane protein